MNTKLSTAFRPCKPISKKTIENFDYWSKNIRSNVLIIRHIADAEIPWKIISNYFTA